jgi:alpha-beta hydrolase superfamily lysophospholipase
VKAPWLIACATVVLGGAAAADEGYPLSVPLPPGSPPPVCKRLEVPSRDGTKLVVHEWAPPRPAGKPVALFVHGIAMHGEPYGAIAAGFTSQGVPFVVPDLRGHGRSEGRRGDLAPAHILRADLGAVLDRINQRYPGAPVVLIGDSMGGVLATDYAWRGEKPLAGLALMVPAFELNKAQWMNAGGSLKGFLRNGGRVAIATREKIGPSTQSDGFLKARLADRLALDSVRPSYLLMISSLEKDWPRAADNIKVPLFVCVAGKDKVIDNGTAREFFDRAATPEKDKTWLKLDRACHTVCWDPATPQMVDELVKWVLKRAK